MFFSDLPSPNEYTLEEFLTFLLITFNSAVAASRDYPSVASFFKNPHHKDVYNVNRGAGYGELPPGTSEEMVNAYKKWNLCDHFCFFLYMFLKNFFLVLGKGYEITWANVRARPTYAFQFGDMPQGEVDKRLKDPRHSILIIRTKSGHEIAFDGTPEQFGWGGTSSIMDIETFWDQHVEGDKDDWVDDGETQEMSHAEVERRFGRY